MQIKTLKSTLLSFYYYNLFSTFFSTLTRINFSSAYNYKGITIGILKEINNKGFIIRGLTVTSILIIIIKIIIIKEKFTIFEFINN